MSFFFFSCTNTLVSTKKVVYFQGKYPNYPAYVTVPPPPVSKIQKDDILAITVNSLNKESNEILNFSNNTSIQNSVSHSGGGANGGGNGSGQASGYIVDSLGNVMMPFIGNQKVEGLSLQAATEKIKLALERILKDPSVNVRYANHKFSVLGDVHFVGTFSLLDDHTTIIEALTMAGDLTITGRRDSITIIRNANGLREKEIGRVSLLNREVFSSPYFYIKNGDVIYVEPSKEKLPTSSEAVEKEKKLQRTITIMSFVTSLLVIYSLFIKK